MPLAEDKVKVQAVIDQKALDQIDKLAKKIGISRSMMIRNLIYSSLEDIGVLSKIGLLDAGLMVRGMVEHFKENKPLELGEKDEVKD